MKRFNRTDYYSTPLLSPWQTEVKRISGRADWTVFIDWFGPWALIRLEGNDAIFEIQWIESKGPRSH